MRVVDVPVLLVATARSSVPASVMSKPVTMRSHVAASASQAGPKSAKEPAPGACFCHWTVVPMAGSGVAVTVSPLATVFPALAPDRVSLAPIGPVDTVDESTKAAPFVHRTTRSTSPPTAAAGTLNDVPVVLVLP